MLLYARLAHTGAGQVANWVSRASTSVITMMEQPTGRKSSSSHCTMAIQANLQAVQDDGGSHL